jgi:6-pyruvoyltetrahydropterin/6-carboxytetrahydropterin synthase
MSIKFEFEATKLNASNWVVDFGSIEGLKYILKDTFDHTTIVAKDDPFLDNFKELNTLGIINLVIVDRVGCEAFAELTFKYAEAWLLDQPDYKDRVRVVSSEVREHGANSALYIG